MRDSANFCSMDAGLKCDAFGRFEVFRFVRLKFIEFQRNSRLYKPLACVTKFRNFAFCRYPDAPRWSVGILQYVKDHLC